MASCRVRMTNATTLFRFYAKTKEIKAKHTLCETIDNTLSSRYIDTIRISRIHLRSGFSAPVCRGGKSANIVTKHDEEYLSRGVSKGQFQAVLSKAKRESSIVREQQPFAKSEVCNPSWSRKHVMSRRR